MKISVELFLLDNSLMNLAIFLLAASLSGMRVKPFPLCLFSLGGAVYALLSLFVWPPLQQTPVRLAAFLLLGVPLWEKGTSFWKTLLSVLISACMVGGTVLGITLLTGGAVRAEGTIVGTLPLRTALIGFCGALALPRVIRALWKQRSMRALQTRISVRINGEEYILRAMIDTGNGLIEPISGLPIVLLQNINLPAERVVVYQTQDGEGVLFAAHAEQIILLDYGGCSVNAYAASVIQPIADADAILPASLLPLEWRKSDETMVQPNADSITALSANRTKKRLLVYSHRRNSPRTARRRRGGAMHRSSANRKVGQG